MSPEQTRGTDAIDHRADLWALAVIAFECLTGRLPFAAGTMSELFEQITAGTLPVPSEIAADLPARVDGWWLRAASRTIDERFQSARELVHEFGSALGVADSGSSTSLVPFERTLPKGSLPGRRDGPSSGRLLQIGYAVAAVALVAALLLPFAQRAYGHRARSEVAAFAAPRAEEATYGAPRTTLARIEVLAMPPGSTRSIQRSTWPRLLPARAPHQGRPAGARPSPRDDPDGVLGI
jgi:serine/threonine-protein kinase